MAEKKERKIVDVNSAEGKAAVSRKTVKSPAAQAVAEKPVDREVKDVNPERKPVNTVGMRIGSVILWVLALGCEIGAIVMLNMRVWEEASWGVAKGPANNTGMIITIALLAAAAICCIIGALLWKKANRTNPCKSKNKVLKFLWDQMGVIACIVCFIPFGLVLLFGAKNLTAKQKTIIAIIAAVLFAGSTAGSIDYNPTSPEDVAAAEQAAQTYGDGSTAYWTRWGKSYHFDENCQALQNSDTLFKGTIEDALNANRTDPCDFCAGGADLKD